MDVALHGPGRGGHVGSEHDDRVGKYDRTRQRASDRQANAVLRRIVVVRLCHDHRTKSYMCRRTGEGMSKIEVIRCIKRHVAREVFAALQSSEKMAGVEH